MRSAMNTWKIIYGAGLLAACVALNSAQADRQKSGNEMALNFSTSTDFLKDQMASELKGGIYFFRYLKVTNIVSGDIDGAKYVTMSTVEPSSDMVVNFRVTKKVSLQIVNDAKIKVGDGIAISGCVKTIDKKTGTILMDPVIVRYKDLLSPKAGKELLAERDPTARYGSENTSRGVEATYLNRDGTVRKEVMEDGKAQKNKK